MNLNASAKRLSAPVIALLVLNLLACDLGLQGNEGTFRFRDETPSPSTSTEVLRPLAVGARLHLGVSGATQVVEASSSDEDVVEVVSFGRDFVEVRGGAPGNATIDVTDLDGSKDSIDIEVRQIHNAEIKLMPWASTFPLPEDLWSEGAVLLYGAPLSVFVELQDESGELLTGSGAAEWQVAQGGAATISADRGDFATLRAMADIQGPVEVRFGEWASLSLEVVGADAVAEVGLYSQTEDVGAGAGEALTLGNDRNHLMHLTAFTEDGRYIIGAGTEAIDPEVDEAAPFEIVLDAGSAQGEDSEGLVRALANGRAFLLKTTVVGQDELTVDWLGTRYSFEIQVR